MRIGIVGYGNLARGAECAIPLNPDMELVAVFSRRDPSAISLRSPGVPVVSLWEILQWKDNIDVLLLCGGSASDLPKMTPELAKHFHVIDSFDTHAKISEHYASVNAAAQEGQKVALISAGWDPGLFSLNRLYASALLPQGAEYTFWGTGVSQGHSDAVRRIPGVLDCRQYTIPIEDAVEAVRRGDTPTLSTAQKHRRHCYVVAAPDADTEEITRTICTMPNYFADYDTTVEFITQEEMERDHKGLPHGGCVIRSGKTGFQGEHTQTIEYRLKLDSNPEFTASVLLACARAVGRMAQRGATGCYTMFDIAPADLSPLSREDLMKKML